LRNNKTRFLTQFSALFAILILFCFTPLGALPAFGPIVATLGMIPVILTAQLLGTKAGAWMGFFAGLFSLMVWTFMPPSPIVAFVFTPFYSVGVVGGNFGSVLISLVPRILTGMVAGLSYSRLSQAFPTKQVLCLSLSAVLGSLTNTLGVMGGIWLFFGDAYASILGEIMLLIIGTTILTSGIPEAIVSAIASSAVCRPIQTMFLRDRSV